jgi:hypothetical protein
MTRTIDIDQYEVEFEILEAHTNTHFCEEEYIAKGYEIISVYEDGVEVFDYPAAYIERGIMKVI